MRRTRTSASVGPLGVAILLATVFGLTSWQPSVGDAPRTVVDLISSMFPVLSAESVVTGSDNVACRNEDVNSGNQVTITLTSVGGRTTGSETRTFDSNSRSVNLIGAPGSTISDTFFSGLAATAGSYNRLDITLSSQMTYQGAVRCVIGGQTRYYYSNGSSSSSPYVTTNLTGARNQSDHRSTTVTVSGGNFQLPLNYTIVDGGSTTLYVAFDVAMAVYDLGSSTYVVFPAASASFAAQ